MYQQKADEFNLQQDMQVTESNPLEKLEATLFDTTGVYVNPAVDEDSYFAELAEDIKRHVCDPFPLSAVVRPPGFPDAKVGDIISGICVAFREEGYWLVYQPEQERFYCFWGTDRKNLGAHGVFGSPMYCWSA